MNDIEKKIEELKSEFLTKLETLQKEVKMQQGEQKLWKPEIGESYFFIRSDFGAMNKVKGTTSFETDRISNGNCFKTKERAEQVAKKMRLLLRLEQLHDMLCPDYVPDFGSGEATYCLYYDYSSSHWAAEGWYDCNCRVNGPYFDTLENAEKAAEILNKEMRESK